MKSHPFGSQRRLSLLKLNTALRAGFDPRSYCLQGCVTQVNQCSMSGGEECAALGNECIANCVGSSRMPPSYT
jgi:hypothetical protein